MALWSLRVEVYVCVCVSIVHFTTLNCLLLLVTCEWLAGWLVGWLN